MAVDVSAKSKSGGGNSRGAFLFLAAALFVGALLFSARLNSAQSQKPQIGTKEPRVPPGGGMSTFMRARVSTPQVVERKVAVTASPRQTQTEAIAQETVSYEEEGEEAEEEEEAHLVLPAPNSLRIQLAPLEMNNTDDTLTILPEEYRVPDVRFCGKVLRAEPDVRNPEDIRAAACRCGEECDALDFPGVSYLFDGISKGYMLRKGLDLVETYHKRYFGQQPKETIVYGDGLPFGGYLSALKPVREHAVGMARMANAPKVMHITETSIEAGTLPKMRDRKRYLESIHHCSSELDLAVVMQYFRRPAILPNLLKMLKKLPGNNEILVNDDSASELNTFKTYLANSRHTVLVSGDIHEIRGYNRLSKLVHAKILIVLQDDDMPPVKHLWIDHLMSAFNNNKKLGFIGGFTGTIQGGPQTGKFGVGRSTMPTKAANKRPFMFVTLTNIGPFVMRQDLFWHTGMFNMNFSCRGDPGIGFDYEFSLRTWWKGYQVGLFKPDFVYHWGDWSKSGTRANRGLYRRRQTIEKRNSKYHLDMYGPRSGRDFYWRQGLPGRPTAFKTPREGLKGIGVLVHDANDALRADPWLGGG